MSLRSAAGPGGLTAVLSPGASSPRRCTGQGAAIAHIMARKAGSGSTRGERG